jgi:SAM-dependent methyltransferase
MHWTVKRTFKIFLEKYCDIQNELVVLEIGSANVNGGLREEKLENMTWVGVDIREGPGVDFTIKVGEKLPFDSHSFDLVVASSVFEHDIQFWNTFLEMSRVIKPDGLLILIMPSQGSFHRFPLDAFRFYPDSGIALEKWGQFCDVSIQLIESFTTRPMKDVWADYVAIYSTHSESFKECLIGGILEGENWIVGSELMPDSYQEHPYEIRRIFELETENQKLRAQLEKLNNELILVKNSTSWSDTYLLRSYFKWIR